MPDNPDAQIPISQEVRRKLQSERKRTGVSTRVLLDRRKDVPNGLTASQIRRWANGLVKSAAAAHVEYVIQLWVSLPDDAGRTDKWGTKIAGPGFRYPKPGEHWITITEEMRDNLGNALRESRLRISQFAKIADAPSGLTVRMISGWIYGGIDSAREEHWDFVLSQCSLRAGVSTPTTPPSQPKGNRPPETLYFRREMLTDDQCAELCAHAKRTGVGAIRLLRGAHDQPPGVSAHIIDKWINGTVRSAVPAHFQYVLKRWATLPNNLRMPLTPDMRGALRKEFARTGMGPGHILKQTKDIPAGLTRAIIQSWVGKDPKPGTVDEASWAYVMRWLRNCPDA